MKRDQLSRSLRPWPPSSQLLGLSHHHADCPRATILERLREGLLDWAMRAGSWRLCRSSQLEKHRRGMTSEPLVSSPTLWAQGGARLGTSASLAPSRAVWPLHPSNLISVPPLAPPWLRHQASGPLRAAPLPFLWAHTPCPAGSPAAHQCPLPKPPWCPPTRPGPDAQPAFFLLWLRRCL